MEISGNIDGSETTAFTNRLIFAEDIASHPNSLYRKLSKLALAEGLASCWSHTVRDDHGNVIAILVIYYSESRAPSKHELAIINAVAPVIMIAHKAQLSRAALIKERNKAEALAESRRLFIANLNHELRTPLNHIIGFSELLLSNPKYKTDEWSIEAIKSAGKDLLAKVEKAIEIAASHESIPKEKFDLVRFWHSDIHDHLQNLLDQTPRDVSIIYTTKHIPVLFSKTNLKQAVLYILDNAIKYTETEGKIFIKIERVNQKWAIISIADNGVGMSEKMIKSATKAFEVADPSYTRKHGGLGLGLTAADKLLQQSLGKLEIQSTLGKGTNVKIWIPMA